jgi:hypothetical protein
MNEYLLSIGIWIFSIGLGLLLSELYMAYKKWKRRR